MACTNCSTNHPSDSCADVFRFTLDDTYLIPRCGQTPLEPLDLEPAVKLAETDTRLQLDVVSKSLVYTGEQASNNIASPDTIPIASIASLIRLDDLQDVEYPLATEGDLLQWDAPTGRWISYTVPEGDIETPVGIDTNGKLVKSGTAPDPGSADTIPLAGVIIWTAPVLAIPVGFRECDGSAISRSVYAGLFSLIGTTYGAGDGSTTFNLPNMQTRTVAGLSSGDTQFDTIGETGGAKTVNLSHAHVVNPHNHNEGNVNTGDNDVNHTHSGIVRGVAASDGINQNHRHAYTRSARNDAPGTNAQLGDTSVLSPYIVMPYIMRVI